MVTRALDRTTTVKEWMVSLIGGVPFGILGFDLSGLCVVANTSAGEAFDCAADALVDRRWSDLVECWPELGGAADGILDFRHDLDLPGVRRGDRVFDLRMRRVIDGLLVTIDDTTEAVRLRDEQSKLVEELEAANGELAEFAYICAHDMKSPVASLVGLIDEMATIDDLPDAASNISAMIHRSVQQLDQTIRSLNEVLAVRDAASGERLESDLAEVVGVVLEEARCELDAIGASLVVSIDAGLRVRLAPAHLHSVIQNLVSNAVQYRDRERPLRLSVSIELVSDTAVLTVADNGCGFDAERHGERVFGLFDRLHRDRAGSGVGLYLVRSLLQASGGSVSVQSAEGVGSTFEARIPHV